MRNNDEQELERYLRILSSGVEKKVTIERILNEDIRTSGKIIEIMNDTSLDVNSGGIEEQTTFKIRALNCGCIVSGRQDVGGICQLCQNIVCKNHIYRCKRCHLALCPKCVHDINGTVYCLRCSRIMKVLRFFRLRK
jgi:hypothetical protein